MLQDFFSGIRAYGKALKLIPKLGLWKYLFLPWLISILLLGAVFYIPFNYAGDIGDWYNPNFSFEWLNNLIDWALTGLGGLVLFFLGLFLLKYLVLILSGPFMSVLSEKVEESMIGGQKKSAFSIKRVAREFSRGVRIAIRNLFKELLFTVILLILGIFFAPFSAVGLFMVQAYYFGFGNMDFALERHFGVHDSIRFVKQNRAMALGNGAVIVVLLAAAPVFFNFLIALVLPIAAFVLPIGVIAATIETVNRLDIAPMNEEIEYNNELV